ncbi:MAG: transcription antitermination factor NusB [Acidimicrobiales bacterium]
MSELGTKRHHSRERALEIFYEATIKERSVATVLNQLPVQPDAYTIALLTSAAAHQERANELISRFSIDWPLERLAMVDRLVMTLAIGEMLMDDPPPAPVILDEAVELAKVYSTEGSASFVNGVLAACAEHLNL